jgi:hypothetical protein
MLRVILYFNKSAFP